MKSFLMYIRGTCYPLPLFPSYFLLFLSFFSFCLSIFLLYQLQYFSLLSPIKFFMAKNSTSRSSSSCELVVLHENWSFTVVNIKTSIYFRLWNIVFKKKCQWLYAPVIDLGAVLCFVCCLCYPRCSYWSLLRLLSSLFPFFVKAFFSFCHLQTYSCRFCHHRRCCHGWYSISGAFTFAHAWLFFSLCKLFFSSLSGLYSSASTSEATLRFHNRLSQKWIPSSVHSLALAKN